MMICSKGRTVALRRAGKHSSFLPANSLHTTAIRLDFFSWFKKKKEQQKAPEPTSTKDTRELIKDIEAGKKSKFTKKEKLDLKPENFIGADPAKSERKARQLLINDIPFNTWLTGSKVTNEKDLENILVECFNVASKDLKVSSAHDQLFGSLFPDLVTKFKFTKALQAQTGYLIPDNKLTMLNTPKQFAKYFISEVISGKLAYFKESEPNAIDLSTKDFSSPNVYIAPDVDVASQRKRFGKIMHEVQSMEAQNTRDAIEKAKRG